MRLRDRLKNHLNRRAAYRFFIRDWVSLGDIRTAAQIVSTMRFTQSLAPTELEMPQAHRILVVAPHPDDEAIGAGGTIARMSQNGKKVRVVFASGTETLRTEAAESSKILGFESVFLRHPIGCIPLAELADDLARETEAFRPGALFLPFFLDDHDDHRRVTDALIRATNNGRDLGGPEIWAYQVYTSLITNVVVDITDQAAVKRHAIETYRSQAAIRDWAHWALGLNAFNIRHLSGRRSSAYAEAFFVLPFADYIDLAKPYFSSESPAYYAENYS